VDFWEFFFLMLIFIPITILWIACIMDVVGRIDLSGVSKMLWVIGIIIFPVVGSLAYVVLRPSPMELEVRRDEKMAQLYRRSEEVEARSQTQTN
jgi:hypothetical protein